MLSVLILLASATQAEEKPTNFVLFLVDDLGWTDVACYGSDLYQTPNIDRLAREGVRFTDGYAACTVCSPTRAAVLTGQYPARLHVTDWIHGHVRKKAKLKIPDWTHHLPHETTTIAEVLTGHVSLSIGKWHLGAKKHWPKTHGFDLNIGGYLRGQPPSYFSPYKIPTLKDGPKGEYLTDRLADEACAFLEAHKDRPFFLYFPFYTVHTPLQGKYELVQKYANKKFPAGQRHKHATYAAMIESLDQAVGKVLSKLADLGLVEKTVVFFTGDNGGLRRVTSNAPLRAGKGSAYEGGVRVPFLVRWPGVTKPGGVCVEPVTSVDFMPTILEMARIRYEGTLDGTSLVPLLRNPAARLARDAIYWHYPHYHPGGAKPHGAVRARRYKLIEFYEDMNVELYDLERDLGEQNYLSDRMPGKAAELREKLHEWRKSVGAQMPTPNR